MLATGQAELGPRKVFGQARAGWRRSRGMPETNSKSPVRAAKDSGCCPSASARKSTPERRACSFTVGDADQGGAMAAAGQTDRPGVWTLMAIFVCSPIPGGVGLGWRPSRLAGPASDLSCLLRTAGRGTALKLTVGRRFQAISLE